jgi:cytochrome c biogenesis protein CcmG/thiol:disulfide interchange protein DsbE
MWRRLLWTLAAIAPLIALFAYGFSRDPRYISSPLVGRPAPDFQLTLLNGKKLALADLKGRVVVLNFWASWCLPCREEAAGLEESWRKSRGREVLFLGVSIQDREENAVAFTREFDVTYPLGRDLSGKISIDYGVWGIPETFFIDTLGRITYKHVGAITPATLLAKLDESSRGIVTAEEGRGSHLSIR